MVALMAYKKMNKKNKLKCVEILKQHPDIIKWNDEFSKLKNVPYEDFLMMQASTYPDDIRNSKNPNDHPTWHYVDYKIDANNLSDKTIMNPDANILTALKINLELLNNHTTSIPDKAIALCWVVHLVGDIHQPLHCSEFYNDEFKKGDKGGNSIWVKVDSTGAAVKLHSYWDGLLGKSEKYKSIYQQSLILLKQIKFKKTVADTSYMAWSNESFEIAKLNVYLSGKLPALLGVLKKETAPIIPNCNAYNKNSVAIAEKQIVKAGYRLSKIISH
jgi:hypothetical protein